METDLPNRIGLALSELVLLLDIDECAVVFCNYFGVRWKSCGLVRRDLRRNVDYACRYWVQFLRYTSI